MNRKQHKVALEEISRLAALDPHPASPQGRKLKSLVALVEAYEKQHFPINTDSSRGVYRKYVVTRTDGSSMKGGKHEKCAYFVLDLEHDEFAIPALKAYAKACKKSFPKLAKDLQQIIDIPRPCGCRAISECMHRFWPKTPSEKLAHKLTRSEEP